MPRCVTPRRLRASSLVESKKHFFSCSPELMPNGEGLKEWSNDEKKEFYHLVSAL